MKRPALIPRDPTEINKRIAKINLIKKHANGMHKSGACAVTKDAHFKALLQIQYGK